MCNLKAGFALSTIIHVSILTGCVKEPERAPFPSPRVIVETWPSPPPERIDALRAIVASDPSLFMVVNTKRPLPSRYVPPDLVDLGTLSLPAPKGFKARAVLVQPLLRLVAMARERGFTPWITSAYRSISDQEALYAELSREKGENWARHHVAPPGASLHHTGLALDIGYADSPEKENAFWAFMHEEAWKLGFSLSFPEDGARASGGRYEYWHFRYLGPEACALIREGYFADEARLLLYLDSSTELTR